MMTRCSLVLVLMTLLPAAALRAEHPPFALLDADGTHVLVSGLPVSTMSSCQPCHDTQYIAAHSYHSSPGTDSDGRTEGNRGEGCRGEGSGRQTIKAISGRHPWDWHAAEGGEMNCFLCHMAQPDNAARIRELEAGRSSWANTATLAATGVIQLGAAGWAYERGAFLPDGRLAASTLQLGRARSENCGLCHGVVDRGERPVRLELSLRQWSTATTGQVFSPQRISASALNLAGKSQTHRAWDVHAERLLECTSCHHSVNNPAYDGAAVDGGLRHLRFDPRLLTASEFLRRPNHDFATGWTEHDGPVARARGTMRRCDDCHNAADAHAWLPSREVHFARLSCEACHIPQVFAPAVGQVDWTLLTPSGDPQVHWRGVSADTGTRAVPITGFRPVLLPTPGRDGRSRLVPHNLVSAWYWSQGDGIRRPVRLDDLKAALFEDGQFHPDVAAALGIDGAQPVPPRAYALDTAEKAAVVRRRLESLGVVQPRIESEILPYRLHHGVGPAKAATRQCDACHTADSRLAETFLLASYLPGGSALSPAGSERSVLSGTLQSLGDGSLWYRPGLRGSYGKQADRNSRFYVPGHSRWPAVDALGSLLLLAVVLGVAIHAGMRMRAAWRRPRHRRSPAIAPLREELTLS